ncbi:MAG: pitrilysin family protein [Acidobacteriota bacterium]
MKYKRTWGVLCLALACAALAPVAAQEPAKVPVVEVELDNGLKMLLVRRPELTTVSAAWVAKVGSADERPGITGMAHLFEHMMFKGTKTIGTTNIERDLEIIDEQEALQNEIREIYREQRERFRRGEIEDPYATDARPQELIDLETEFTKLVEEQREIMVKDEYDKIYTSEGQSFLNAFTSTDVTVYLNRIPANKLELWFWMESDRLLNPVFREFYAERDVVYEERRLRTESTPTGEFDEQLNAMFWQSHPYSWPTIGWPSDLRVISKEQADDFFRTYYAPNNITAVLVGNFEIDRVKELAERYFGRLPRGPEAPDVVTLEMNQKAEKRLSAECDCQPQIEIRYHTESFVNQKSYPLDVLAGVLSGRTGRLFKTMVEGSEVASRASASHLPSKFAGYFSFLAETKGESTPADLEAAWDEVVADLQENLVSEEELRKVKNREIADTYRRLQDPLFLSIQLALYEGQGDYRYLDTLQTNVEAVTAEQIREAARTYLVPERRLVGHYTRKSGSKAEEVPPELTDVPAEQRQAILAQLRQLRSFGDAEQLQAIAEQIEAQAGQAPPEMKPVVELMLRTAKERLAELEGDGGEE